CGQSLVDHKHGTAEEANLLSSYNRRRAAAQSIDICERLRRSVPGFVLAFKNRAHALPARWIVLDSGGFRFHPFGEIRRMRIEGANAGRVCEKVGKKARGVRNLGKG